MSWVSVEKITQQVLWLVLFSILAPILGPGPYGEFAIVMVFIGFCELVLGDGMVEVLVTLVAFEQPHVATTNLVAGLAALGLGVVLCCLAPLIGAVFHNDAIRPLMTALALLPLLSFLSAAPIAMLQRETLRFQRLALRSIASFWRWRRRRDWRGHRRGWRLGAGGAGDRAAGRRGRHRLGVGAAALPIRLVPAAFRRNTVNRR